MNKLKKKRKRRKKREYAQKKKLTTIAMVLNLCVQNFLYVNKSF